MERFSDQSAVSQALATLQGYLAELPATVNMPELDTKAIEEYFTSDDTERIAQFEKMLGVSAVEAIYNDPNLPKELKFTTAIRGAEEIQDAFRRAKADYEFASGKYGVGGIAVERLETEKKEIALCRKATILERLKDELPKMHDKAKAKMQIAWVLAERCGVPQAAPIAAAIAYVYSMGKDVWKVVPEPVKEVIKTKAKEIARRGLNIVVNVAQRMAKSPIVQMAKSVVESFIPDFLKPEYEAGKKALKPVITHVTNKFLKKLQTVLS